MTKNLNRKRIMADESPNPASVNYSNFKELQDLLNYMLGEDRTVYMPDEDVLWVCKYIFSAICVMNSAENKQKAFHNCMKYLTKHIKCYQCVCCCGTHCTCDQDVVTLECDDDNVFQLDFMNNLDNEQ